MSLAIQFFFILLKKMKITFKIYNIFYLSCTILYIYIFLKKISLAQNNICQLCLDIRTI